MVSCHGLPSRLIKHLFSLPVQLVSLRGLALVFSVVFNLERVEAFIDCFKYVLLVVFNVISSVHLVEEALLAWLVLLVGLGPRLLLKPVLFKLVEVAIRVVVLRALVASRVPFPALCKLRLPRIIKFLIVLIILSRLLSLLLLLSVTVVGGPSVLIVLTA